MVLALKIDIHIIKTHVPKIEEKRLACFQSDLFNFLNDEVKTLISPEAALMGGELAHDVLSSVRLVTADAQAESVKAHFASKSRDDAFYAIVAIGGAAKLDRERLHSVGEGIGKNDHVAWRINAISVGFDDGRSRYVHERFFKRYLGTQKKIQEQLRHALDLKRVRLTNVLPIRALPWPE